VRPEVDPDEPDERSYKKKAEIAEADVNGFQPFDVKFASLKPLTVLI
jgi:hypothetical protein